MIATPWKYAAMLLLGLAAAGCNDSNGPNPNPGNTPPTANFTFECTDLECTFSNLSSDSDGTVTASAWDFGDAASSNNSNPTHTYASGRPISRCGSPSPTTPATKARSPRP